MFLFFMKVKMGFGVGLTTVEVFTQTGVRISTARTTVMIVFTWTKMKGNGKMEIVPHKNFSSVK